MLYDHIQSEFNYYTEIAAELVNHKLAPTVEQVCRFFGEEEAQQLLTAKAQHLVGRASRATSRAEDELSAEYKQVVALHQSGKSARVVQSYTNEFFPQRVLAVADLKFRLMQCTTSLKHRMLIPKFGMRELFFEQQGRAAAAAAGGGKRASVTAETHDANSNNATATEPLFLQKCLSAVEAALVELLSTGNHQESLDVLLHALGSSTMSDIHEMTMRSLLAETYQIVVGHVDFKTGKAKRAGSLAPSSPPSSGAPSPTVPITPARNPGTPPMQQKQPEPSAPVVAAGAASAPAVVTPIPVAVAAASNASPPTTATSNASFSSSGHHTPHKQKPPFPVPAAAAVCSSSVSSSSSSPGPSVAHPNLPRYDPSMSEAEVFRVLRHFYAVYVPDYVESVGYLVEQHRGKFDALFALVAEKYSAKVIASSANDDTTNNNIHTAAADSSSSRSRGATAHHHHQPQQQQQPHPEQTAANDGSSAPPEFKQNPTGGEAESSCVCQ